MGLDIALIALERHESGARLGYMCHASDARTRGEMIVLDVIAVDDSARRYRVACTESLAVGNRMQGNLIVAPGDPRRRAPPDGHDRHGARRGGGPPRHLGVRGCSRSRSRRGVSPTPGAPREPPLGPRAARAARAVRDRPEQPDPLRTAFQRDRDRILHTTAFRRLKHKTQVFVAPAGDHYRTRLTHTLEVSAVARTTARALALNEDLVEAIAMGHDLGHAPFGHAGEAALDEILRDGHDRHFEHNVQSLRVVEVLERGGEGLNLTDAVRDGILHHTGPGRPATLEGQIVRLMDRIAYVNHDIEDALRAGVLAACDLPAGDVASSAPPPPSGLTTLVEDTVLASAGADEIRQTPEIGTAFLRLRKFLFQNVYLAPPASGEAARARGVVQALFPGISRTRTLLPHAAETDPVTRVTDFVAGMTDRYALRLYREIFMPSEGPL